MNLIRNLFSRSKQEPEYKISNRFYFKVINHNVVETSIDTTNLDSMREYDGEYNYELNNEYFENTWFFSELDKDLLEFQVFFTSQEHFRHLELYEDSKALQAFYLEKYQTPFFWALSNDELKSKFHPRHLGQFLNFEDYKNIIKPNLKLNLIESINTGILEPNGYYVFYNWDFFMEEQVSPNSNSLLRHIATIPHASKRHLYESKDNALENSFNVLLENACSTVDTILKGFHFNLENFDSKVLSKQNYSDNFWIVPAIRSLNEIKASERNREIEKCMKLLKAKSSEPFVIENYS
ncbi:MAG: hypothetical protein HUJ25_00050 [Crocinitomicaceae bacterium]|nr:hypothetical protein [Crocinitomicaceae bacterium]